MFYATNDLVILSVWHYAPPEWAWISFRIHIKHFETSIAAHVDMIQTLNSEPKHFT